MTPNTNHTPGPWTTDEDDHDALYQNIKIKAGKHHTVCTVWIDDAPVRDFNAEQQANARLIAAAPELLEALKQCRLALEPYDDVKPRDWKTDREKLAFAHQAARAAIAKATGC